MDRVSNVIRMNYSTRKMRDLENQVKVWRVMQVVSMQEVSSGRAGVRRRDAVGPGKGSSELMA